ncbi:piwi-like protein 2-like isoform 3 [Reticulomyxa filosa]|uniref:Piwi-like protein 2-like isoform 3 n=1 Tax=Reticulomyxa filosa TaxID=46433 RepID=X6M501_RETFI|nr:piwi-like protein 2-like isoform 3 [Reticulomyxa filosa]|eukprot:ETO09063.1 piwi-like protein 2-like isoform 3 [Reticulomyxa filosa]
MLEKYLRREQKSLHFPPEMCRLTGYPRKEQKNSRLRKEVAKHASIPVSDRVDNMTELIRGLADGSEQNRERRNNEWKSIEYFTEPVTVESRQLPSANVAICKLQGNTSRLEIDIVNEDDWSHALSQSQPYGMIGDQKPYLVRWGDIREFQLKIQHMFYSSHGHLKPCIETALELDPLNIPIPFQQRDYNFDDTLKTLENELQREACDINAVVVVLPVALRANSYLLQSGSHRSNEMYARIKHLCNCKLGVISQCIQMGNLMEDRSFRHTAEGSFRQLLTKIGLMPWKVILSAPQQRPQLPANLEQPPPSLFSYLPDGIINLDKKTMIIGVDVCHDIGAGASVIGFVSTYDRDFVSVYSQVSVQEHGKEVLALDTFCSMVTCALNYFKSINGALPDQIIYYRDGVSTSQMAFVKQEEQRAAEYAFEKKYHDRPLPKLEIIIIQKQVNARFFEQANDGHKCARPIRCIVAEDGLDLGNPDASGVNDLGALTYALCCLYPNWPGPIKVPHVVKHADKIAGLFSQQYLFNNRIFRDFHHCLKGTLAHLNIVFKKIVAFYNKIASKKMRKQKKLLLKVQFHHKHFSVSTFFEKDSDNSKYSLQSKLNICALAGMKFCIVIFNGTKIKIYILLNFKILQKQNASKFLTY